jgi:ribonucleotide monophosphatase NagD (HAD superfamily)
MESVATSSERVSRVRRAGTAIIGDRMDTDIAAGLESGLETILVLTGVTSRLEAERFPFRASLMCDSVADLVDILGQGPTEVDVANGRSHR